MSTCRGLTRLSLFSVALLWTCYAFALVRDGSETANVSADAGFGTLPEATRWWEYKPEPIENDGWRATWDCNSFGCRVALEDIRPPEPKIIPWKRYGESREVYVTAYYCSRVPGWPLGDGGGYCGAMRNGEIVHWGAAACGGYWAMGTVLEIEGYGVVTCKDTGHLGWTQVDIFMPTNADVYSSGILSTYRVVSVVLW